MVQAALIAGCHPQLWAEVLIPTDPCPPGPLLYSRFLHCHFSIAPLFHCSAPRRAALDTLDALGVKG